MIESFSAMLFLDSTLGSVLAGLLWLASLAVGFVAWAKLSHLLRLDARAGLLFKGLRFVTFALLVFGAGLACGLGLFSLPHGKIQTVSVQHANGARVLQVTFTRRGSGRGSFFVTHTSVKAFTLEGKILGGRTTSSKPGQPGMQRVGQVGGADVLYREGEVLLVDPLTHQTLAKVHAALDDAFGASEYRIQGVVPPHVEVQRKDGRLERFDMTPLVPTGAVTLSAGASMLVVGPIACWSENAREGAGFYGKSFEAHGLLRARLLQSPVRSQNATPCEVDVGQPAWLALHRSTAFGDDGAHLLSALPVATPDQPQWTTDLGPALGSLGMERYEIYSPEQRDDALCLWLVRSQQSLSEVCVGRKQGELRSARVVF
jgi:hypothetical protein